MYWYLPEHAETLKYLQQARKLWEEGKLVPVNETGTEHPQDKLIQDLYKAIRPIEAAQGKWMYFPNEKERRFHLQPHTLKFISGGNRPISVDSEIRMADGSIKRLSDIEKGDSVLSLDPATLVSVPAKVVEYVDVGYEECFRIKVSNGSSIDVSYDHPSPVLIVDELYNFDRTPKDHRIERLTPVELRNYIRSGKYVGFPVNHIDSEFIHPIDFWIQTINYIGVKKVACLKIDNPSHIFILANGIPTCNSGKSTACIVDIVAQCEGWHPLQRENLIRLSEEAVDEWVREQCKKLLEKKLWIPSPPIKARCVGIDFPNFVDKVLGPEYERWATQAELKEVSYDNEKRRKIVWKNKSQVEFMTYAQEVIAHGGAAIHVYHLDEEPTEGHYQQALMRIISTNGRILCGMTAEKGVSWTEQKIFEPAEKGDPHVFAMEMSTYDNPIATPEMINTIKSLCLNQAEIDIRIYGKRVAKGGSIFESWKDEHPFVIDRFPIPPEGGMLVMMIDPHPQLPHAVSWMWIDLERQTAEKYPPFRDLPYMYVCGELFEKGGGFKLASYIELLENRLGRKHDLCICDPRGWQKSQEDVNAKSIVEQLNDAAIYPIQGSKNLMGGLVKMKETLDLEWEVILNMQGEQEKITRQFPQLMIFSDLEHHRFEFKNYRWQPPPMTRTGDSKEAPQKPVDKDDHFIENIRRGVEWMRDQKFEIFDTPEYEVEKLRFAANGKEIEVNFEEEESMLIGA